MARYANRHGRRGGRGIRPLLLIPKLLGVGAYFGGLVAAAAIGFAAEPDTAAEYKRLGRTFSVVFRFAAVPGLIVAIACGLGLWALHFKTLGRMRWLRIKLAVLAISVPALHWHMSAQIAALRTVEPDAVGSAAAALAAFRFGLIAALGIAALVVTLGRHKPRLGQPIAPPTRRPAQPTSSRGSQG